jgi:probable DNA repair protein
LYRLPAYLQSGLENAATIVTAHARQAFAVRAAWGEHQRRLGRNAWPTPDVLPLSAWLSRHWSLALDDGRPDLPLLLDPIQERMLWEQIVAVTANERGLLHPHGTAGAAWRAWQRLHDWAIDLNAVHGVDSEETRAFRGWSERAVRTMREHGCIDAPRAVWQCPIGDAQAGGGALMLLGFDEETPARRELVQRLEAREVRILPVPSRPALAAAAKRRCADADAELHAAAWWARRRLERSPTDRLLISIADLGERRARIERILAEILDPASLLVTTARQAPLFALEESLSLDRYPLVATALTALELAAGRVAFDAVSDWLRSPYWLAGDTQGARRARLDVLLRRVAAPELDLPMLLGALANTSGRLHEAAMPNALRRFHDELRKASLTPAGWSEVFSRALAHLGWPGDRVLDSAEFQTAEKFNEALRALAALDRLVGRIDLASGVSVLRRLLEQTPFQPETGDTPVVVTSRLGDPVLVYDGIWVSGVHAGAWPEPPRPDPFIPWAVQAAVGLPAATARGALERARSTLANWMASAAEVVLSWPERRGEEDLDPSPLIATLPELAPEAPPPRYSQIIHASARSERVVDDLAPPLAAAGSTFRGGARALRLQSLCPFRANAEQRLRAQPLEQPQPGIDARTRGSLVHRALEQAWSTLADSDGLHGRSTEERAAVIDAAVLAASREVLEKGRRWPEVARAIETERLRDLLHAWLELEAGRGAFRVLALERAFECTAGGLTFNLRVDRLDQLPDGRQVLVDYKSGEADVKDWWGERPGDPQIPLYAQVLDPAPGALTYALLSAEGCQFAGVSSTPVALAGLDPVQDWPAQLAAWRRVIERLGREFAAGHAAVDPLRTACTTCHLHAFCRIDELTGRASQGSANE